MCHLYSPSFCSHLRVLVVSAIVSFGTHLHAAETYDDLPKRYFELVANAQHVQAIDLVEAETHRKVTDADVEMFRKNKVDAQAIAALVGHYRERELLTEERFGTRLARLTYIVAFEQEALTYTLLLYRPGDKWKFISAEYHSFDKSDPPMLKARSP